MDLRGGYKFFSMLFLYNVVIKFYYLIILISSLFNKKAQLWIKGRRQIFNIIENSLKSDDLSRQMRGKKVWFHLSSLGEFEQGRPLIEAFHKKFPEYKILLTFFSPSGYEIRKNYEYADYIFYLPLDTRKNAKKFIKLTKPNLVFWIKYDFWYHYLRELKQNNIPTYLISAIFRPEHIFFKGYGRWYKKVLNNFTHIFVQNDASKEILFCNKITNVTVAGDTRFDRVHQIAQQTKSFPVVQQFKQNKKILIAGSTHQKDEEIVIKFINNTELDVKFILAPHEIKRKNIDRIIANICKICVCYSMINEEVLSEAQVLIIDNIGMLSSLYQYGDIAYIGGGFGKGLHNIQEPAIGGLPVLFGPNYHKFQEAIDLMTLKGAFSIKNYQEFYNIATELFNNSQKLKECSLICRNYIMSKIGATERILEHQNNRTSEH